MELCSGFSTFLIILRVFGKELSDGIKHCSDKYSDNTENVWNTFFDNMHSLKEFFRNNDSIILRSNWNGFTLSIIRTLNVCLNVLITFPTVWNELSDNMRHCFGLVYVIAVRIFCKKIIC